MRKKLIIADVQEEYVVHLQDYIQKKYTERYEIEVFRNKKQLIERIATSKCDILLITPQLYDRDIKLKNIKLTIVLENENEQMITMEKLKYTIQKYTRISKMINYIEEKYEEIERHRPLIYSVYSPAGGVGQTTVAMGIACSYVQEGKKVLYVNLEETDSTEMFFQKTGDLPESILLKTGQDSEAQMLTEYIKQDRSSQLMYIKRQGIDASLQMEANIGKMIEKVIDLEIANIVVLDLSHQFEILQTDLMKQSDYILLIDDGRTHSRFKINQILKETEGEFLLNEKVKRVINQGKESEEKLPIEVIGQIEKIDAATPFEISEAIARKKLLKLHGLA